jgi:hypothetical protein
VYLTPRNVTFGLGETVILVLEYVILLMFRSNSKRFGVFYQGTIVGLGFRVYPRHGLGCPANHGHSQISISDVVVELHTELCIPPYLDLLSHFFFLKTIL